MATKKTKIRQGEVEYTLEKTKKDGVQHIMRNEQDDKEAIALYDEKAGIVEILPGKDKYKQAAVTFLNNKGKKFKEVCKIGTDLEDLESGDIPPMPKRSRIQGQKTIKLVEWYARYHPKIFLSKYGVQQLQELVRTDEHEREIRDSSGKPTTITVQIPIFENVDHLDYDINLIKSGKQRLLARATTHLTVSVKDDSNSDEYDDDIDATINAKREGDM